MSNTTTNASRTRKINTRGTMWIFIPSLIVSVLTVFVMQDFVKEMFTDRFGEISGDYAKLREWAMLALAVALMTFATTVFGRLVQFLAAFVWLGASSLLAYLFDKQEDSHAVREATRDERIAREEMLARLPAADLVGIFLFVTAAAMVMSTVTTSLGFESLVFDPQRPAWYRWGISIAYSITVSLIIWSCYLPIYRRMRMATSRTGRTVAMFFALFVIVPITLSMSTIAGMVGVGGEAIQKIDYRQYADVLDVSQQVVTAQRQNELSVTPRLEVLAGNFADAERVELTQGTGCGAGEGDLSRFYGATARQISRVNGIIKASDQTSADTDLLVRLADVRSRIGDSDVLFQDMTRDIGLEFKAIRGDIVALQVDSPLNLLLVLDEQLAAVQGDAFFAGWADCQSKTQRKKQIRAQVAGMQASLLSAIDQIEGEGAGMRAEVIERAGGDARFASLEANIVPEFFPLDPFWALVAYYDELPILPVMQIVLDVSPFILALLFAALMPLAKPEDLEIDWQKQSRAVHNSTTDDESENT